MVGLLVVTGLVFAAVAVRLTDVQLISTHRYASYAKAEVLHPVTLPAQRGTLYDSSGNVLAVSEPEATVIADDLQITDPSGEAAKLSPVLSMSQSSLRALLSEKSGFVRVASQVSASATAKVEAMNLTGLTFQSTSQRFLPSGTLALPVIGQVNSAGVGYSGIEEEYNQTLSGHPGSEVIPLGPSGAALPGKPQQLKPASPGQGLVLTINSAIQYDTEQALSKEIVRSQAQSGWAVLLAKDGDILAMANLDAGSTPGSAPVQASRALAMTDVYEPGSVAKLATFAGALTDGLISPDTKLYIPASLSLGGDTFTDAESHGAEQLSATQVLAQSSNIGTIEIAQKLGPQGLYHWLHALGFGQPTGLNFPGDSQGLLPVPSTWSGSTIGSMPIGQAEAVSALQIADAYNMVANGGVFVPPRLVEATIGPNGDRHTLPPAQTRRVVPPAVAAQLTAMLTDVVSTNGTAPCAAVPGYTAAGKTGTAQIPTSGSYNSMDFAATFVGYVPAQSPALTMVVSLNQPNSSDYYGGTVAAPVFSQVASDALRLLNVPPGSSANAVGTPETVTSTTVGTAASCPGA
ncbi:MAG: peptidoglycan D,D-transpeptidase FtsI family protein [Acidimicrobiales bacterium]